MAVNLLPLSIYDPSVYDCSGKLEPSSLQIRWQLTCYHFPIDILFMIVRVNSSLFLNQSDVTFKPITTWSPALSCGQFTCYHCLVDSLFMIGPKNCAFLSTNQGQIFRRSGHITCCHFLSDSLWWVPGCFFYFLRSISTARWDDRGRQK